MPCALVAQWGWGGKRSEGDGGAGQVDVFLCRWPFVTRPCTLYLGLAVSFPPSGISLACFLCWFSVGKCQVRFRSRGFFFWQAGRGADDARPAQTVRLSAAMRGHLCVRVRAHARPCLESHKRHQSCQRICIASRNRGHAVLIYEPTNPHSATLGGFLRFLK